MTTASKRLPIHDLHAQAKAHFGNFGDWEVPLYYSSILEEHEAVRTRAGLFDISHMGEFFVSGRAAKGFLDFLLPRRMDRLREGKALYALLLNDAGGILDDLIVYQWSPETFLLIVNAANVEEDSQWIRAHLPALVKFENASEQKSLFALQGPQSLEIVQAIFHCDFQSMGYYHFLFCPSEWGEIFISRTGYTGEDGFEIMVDRGRAHSLWEALIEKGKPWALRAVGFGARDTLRLEAGMLLHGHDMDKSTSPLEAGLEWAVDFDKGNFLGRSELLRQREKGTERRLVGFEMMERGIPRPGFSIEKKETLIGWVTSGTFAPSLKKSIGLGYVSIGESKAGNEIDVVVREKRLKAKVVPLPFYKRPGH